MAYHGITGSLLLALAKKLVRGQDARPYEVEITLKPAGVGSVLVSTMRMDEPSLPITALALGLRSTGARLAARTLVRVCVMHWLWGMKPGLPRVVDCVAASGTLAGRACRPPRSRQ
jgi:hypothetical protein